VEIAERSTIVAAIHSGELYWSKVEIAAPVKDDSAYTSLMDQAANGQLSASKLRNRVRLEASKEDEAEDVKDEPPPRGWPKKPSFWGTRRGPLDVFAQNPSLHLKGRQ
jgi:hypothetical protein